MIRFCLALVVALPVLCPSAVAALENRLAHHPSPYLALHADDPVHWQPWDEQAIAEARAHDKLLYVSVGYFSCHWCHVMQRQSYRDEGIAAVLNSSYVPVKVDRELRPALDAWLLEFVKATRGHAGWPLNVILTPGGHPLVGATYMRPEPFRQLLEAVQARWRSDREELTAIAAQAAAFLSEESEALTPERLPAGLPSRHLAAFVEQARSIADPVHGGFGDGSKFPSVPQLRGLLEAWRGAPPGDDRDRLGTFLRTTLDRMRTRGLRDQLGGGFFRYTTDPRWQVPHFEKMLYDNALLADLYLHAAEVLDEPDLARTGRDTLDFLLRDLATPAGGFAASLSAVDGENVEGGYYLWDAEALDSLLEPDERTIARAVWGMEGAPATEHGYLPVTARAPEEAAAAIGMDLDRARALLASARAKLLAQRARRTLPRDDKVLAGWNGLMLGVLARAAGAPHGDRYRDAARRLREYVVEHLWDGERLARAAGPGGGIGNASLEDYAFVAHGLLAWSRLEDIDPALAAADRALAARLVRHAWARYRVPGGWRLSERDLIPYGRAEPVMADAETPSPSAVLVETTLAVAAATADETLAARARAALRVQHEALVTTPFLYATHIVLMNRHLGG